MTAFKCGDTVMCVGLRGTSAAYNKRAATVTGERKMRNLPTATGTVMLNSYVLKWHDGLEGVVGADKVMPLVLATDDDEWADAKVSALVKSLTLKPPGRGASA